MELSAWASEYGDIDKYKTMCVRVCLSTFLPVQMI